MAPPKNNFRMYAAIGVLMSLLCLAFAGISFASAAVTGPNEDAICQVGVSGMSPGIEVGLIQSGVWTPSPQIIWSMGKHNPFPANSSVQTSSFGMAWAWWSIELTW